MCPDAELLGKAWDILVEHAGASKEPCERERFVQTFTPTGAFEYRFIGNLGFGGKIRISDRKVYVDCYPEDLTPKRRKIIARVNSLLSELAR